MSEVFPGSSKPIHGYLLAAFISVLSACDDQPLRPGSENNLPSTPVPDVPHVCDVVERVFTPKCAGCHGEGGLFPDLTANGAVALLGATSQLYGDAPLLVAGDLEGSLLYRKISGTQSESEGASMPIGPALDEESVTFVAKWIEGGASMDCAASSGTDGGTPTGGGQDGGSPGGGGADGGVTNPSADAGTGSTQPQTVTLCDVNTQLFAPKCVSCHGADGQAPDLSMEGALTSLVNVEGAGAVVRVVPGDASASLLLQKLEGTADGARMPLNGMATAAEINLVRRWIEQGANLDCSSAVDAGPATTSDGGGNDMTMTPPDTSPPICSSGSYWTQGNDGSPRMHPGRACLNCHQALAYDEDTPDLWVGGTVYPTLHEPDGCHGADGEDDYEGAFVRLEDALGRIYDVDVNRNGNFMLYRNSQTPFEMPFQASVHYDGRERKMHGAKETGDCNSCHTVGGDNGAPGRIYLP